eukprot:8339289-Karenia_brevis.AAC.1
MAVARSPIWLLLAEEDIAALSQACVVCCGQRTWEVLQVLLLGRSAEELVDIPTTRVFLRTSSTGELVPVLDDDGEEYRKIRKIG